MEGFQEPQSLPDYPNAVDTMKRRLKTKSGKAAYAKQRRKEQT